MRPVCTGTLSANIHGTSGTNGLAIEEEVAGACEYIIIEQLRN